MTRLARLTDSFRNRLAVGYVTIAVIFSAAWLFSLYGPLTDAVLSQQSNNLVAVAQAGALVVAQPGADPAAASRQLVARTDVRVTVVASDGTVLADSENDPAAMENHGQRPEIAAALAGRTGSARRLSATERQQTLYVAVPASLDGERIALRVSQPLSEIHAIAASSRRFGLVLAVVALALSSGVAVWAARAAAAPVAALSSSADRMAAGDLAAPIPDVPADLSVLSRALDTLKAQMRSRLEALESEKLTLRSAVDGLEDAVLLLEGSTIRLANEAAARMFSTPAETLAGRTVDEVGLPAPLLSALEDHLSGGESAQLELETDPLGRTLRLVVAPLPGEPSRRHIVVIGDITERARLESVRRDFVANASHELKTPVAGIHLLAESALAAADDGDHGQALAFTRSLGAETMKLQHLVGDLLDLSRLESTPSADAVTDMRTAADHSLAAHRAAAQRKGLRLELDDAGVSGAHAYAAADPTDVAIALDNLLDNAIAYTEQGSVTLSITAGDDHVSMTVSDTGPGIAANHLPRIFERFYRVDAARSRANGGTGLGLALVKHVAERSGGTVSVESTVGRGTAFTLRFPRAT